MGSSKESPDRLFFNVLSGGLTECQSVEPRHVGVSTAGSLHTRTLLSIPQWVIRVKVISTTSIIIVTSLTVVVTANKRRRHAWITIIAGTTRLCPIKIQSISISPNVFTRSTMCDGYSFNIYTVNCY